MIAAIANSELLDFTIPHAGLIIGSGCGFQQEVRDMVHQQIPVYFLWGQRSATALFDERFHFHCHHLLSHHCCLSKGFHSPHVPQELCKRNLKSHGNIWTEELVTSLRSIANQIHQSEKHSGHGHRLKLTFPIQVGRGQPVSCGMTLMKGITGT